MDSIEPFDYSELKPFSTAYLPGFLADRYDEDAKTCARILRAYRTGEGDGPEGFTRGLYYRGVE